MMLQKEISKLFTALGLAVLAYNIIFSAIKGIMPLSTLYTDVFVITVVILSAIGIKVQNKVFSICHLAITYICMVVCMYDSTDNIGILFFLIINYFLMVEYGILKKTWHHLSFLSSHTLHGVLSVLVFGNSAGAFVGTAILAITMIYFYRIISAHIMKQGIEIMKDGKNISKEILQTSKEILRLANRQIESLTDGSK